MEFRLNGKTYDGYVWAGITDRQYCQSPTDILTAESNGNGTGITSRGVIANGIGVHFEVPEEGGFYFVTSLANAGHHTDLALDQMPWLGVNPRRVQLANSNGTCVQSDHPLCRDTAEAIEQVALRVQLERKFGIKLGQANTMEKYYDQALRHHRVSPEAAEEVRDYVHERMTKFHEPTLYEAQLLLIVAAQLTAIREAATLKSETNQVAKFFGILRNTRYLSSRQMASIHKMGRKYNLQLNTKDLELSEPPQPYLAAENKKPQMAVRARGKRWTR